jgi:ATP-dependent RNA circularization protein (DNA/RNA ligase family)
MFKEGESVFITEKIHGENIRFYYQDGQMYVGSRSSWKREFPKVIDPTGIPADVLERLSKFRNRFWEVLTPEIERFCKECRGYTLFGEKYGHNKNFNYDASKEKPKFLAFDIYDHNDNEWLCPASTLHICKFYNIPHVPVLYTHKPFNYDEVMAMCDGESLVENSKNIREGIVIKGDIYSDLHHRRVLKLVSAEFHNRK